MCHLLAILGAHPILHVSRIRVNLASKIKVNYISVKVLCSELQRLF